MERFDADNRHIADVIAAVDRGEDVVIVRDGAVVAEVRPAGTQPRHNFDMSASKALRARFPIRIADGGALVRELRDADDL